MFILESVRTVIRDVIPCPTRKGAAWEVGKETNVKCLDKDGEVTEEANRRIDFRSNVILHLLCWHYPG